MLNLYKLLFFLTIFTGIYSNSILTFISLNTTNIFNKAIFLDISNLYIVGNDGVFLELTHTNNNWVIYKRDVIQYDGDNVVGLPYYVEIQSIDIAYTEDQDDDIEGLDDLNLYLEEN